MKLADLAKGLVTQAALRAAIKVVTISGTTTSTGALEIPEVYRAKPWVGFYCSSGVALVYRRDYAYFMVTTSGFQPLSNTQVSIVLRYLDL